MFTVSEMSFKEEFDARLIRVAANKLRVPRQLLDDMDKITL